MAYQVAVRQGTSSPIEAKQGSPVRGKRSETAPAPALGVLYDAPAAQLLHLCRGPRSAPFMLSGGRFSQYGLLWVQVR